MCEWCWSEPIGDERCARCGHVHSRRESLILQDLEEAGHPLAGDARAFMQATRREDVAAAFDAPSCDVRPLRELVLSARRGTERDVLAAAMSVPGVRGVHLDTGAHVLRVAIEDCAVESDVLAEVRWHMPATLGVEVMAAA